MYLGKKPNPHDETRKSCIYIYTCWSPLSLKRVTNKAMQPVPDEHHTFRSAPTSVPNGSDREAAAVPASAEGFLQNLVFCQEGNFGLGINFLLQNMGFNLFCYYWDSDTAIDNCEVVQMPSSSQCNCNLLSYACYSIFSSRQTWTNCNYSSPESLAVQ